MADDLLLAQYPKQQCVRDRNYAALLVWSRTNLAIANPPISSPPTIQWVRERVLAIKLPSQASTYVDRYAGYFLQAPQTTTNIRLYLNAWNDETTENTLSAELVTIIGAFIPGAARYEITDAEVVRWYEQNGYPVPPELLPPALPFAGMMPPSFVAPTLPSPMPVSPTPPVGPRPAPAPSGGPRH